LIQACGDLDEAGQVLGDAHAVGQVAHSLVVREAEEGMRRHLDDLVRRRCGDFFDVDAAFAGAPSSRTAVGAVEHGSPDRSPCDVGGFIDQHLA
jgi:hypothetical protein